MERRVRLAVIAFLVPWSVLLLTLYVMRLAEQPPWQVLVTRGARMLVFVLAAGVPAAVLWFAETRWKRVDALRVLLFVTGAAVAAIAAGAQVAVPLGVAVLMLASAWGFGAALAGAAGTIEGRGTWQDAPFLAALGWTVWIVIGLIAGSSGVLTTLVVALGCTAGLLLAVRRFARSRPAPAAPRTGAQGLPVVAWWGFALLALTGLIGAVAPEVRYDALAAHLPIAREFAAHGRIVEMQHNVASYFALNGDLLYAMGMLLLNSEAVPKLLHTMAGVLAGLVGFDVGLRLWGPRAGISAAVLLAGTPLIWWVGSSAYTDLWIVLFVTAAVRAMLHLSERPGWRSALVAGALMGAALGTKITSTLVVMPLSVVALWWIMKGAGRTGLRWGRGAMAGAFAAGVAVTGAYFYGRSLILTGTPVFPFRIPFPSGSITLSTIIEPFQRAYGFGRGLQELLLLPWHVTFFPTRFGEDGNIGIGYLALLPVGVLASLRGAAPLWMTGVFVAAAGVWFLTAQYLRFFLPALPLAALIAAAGLFRDPLPRPAARAAAAVLVLSLAASAGAWVVSGPWNFPIAVVWRTVSREDYAASYVRGYRVARFVAESLPSEARIFTVGDDAIFYYERYVVTTSYHGRRAAGNLRAEVPAAQAGRDVQATLWRAGFSHLVVRRDGSAVHPAAWIDGEAFWEEGPRLEYADQEHYLFALDPATAPRTPGADLLPRHRAPLRLEPDASPLVEQVPARAGALYVLEARARAIGRSGTVRLGLRWVDARGQAIDAGTWREAAAGGSWTRIAIASTAPEVATQAALRLSAAQSDGIEVIEMRFYELR